MHYIAPKKEERIGIEPQTAAENGRLDEKINNERNKRFICFYLPIEVECEDEANAYELKR